MQRLVRVVTAPGSTPRTSNALDIVSCVGSSARRFDALNASEGVRLMRRLGVRVSERYWDGSGVIHAGKIGHWASLLAFWHLIATQPVPTVGVWIEDDLRFDAQAWRTLWRFMRTPSVHRAPLWRASRYDACLVVPSRTAARHLLDRVRNDTIDNPSDVWLARRALVRPAPVLFQTHRLASTITTTNLVSIRSIA